MPACRYKLADWALSTEPYFHRVQGMRKKRTLGPRLMSTCTPFCVPHTIHTYRLWLEKLVVWVSIYTVQNQPHLPFTLKKHAIRIIYISNLEAHTDKIYKELSIPILKLHSMYLLELGQFMYSYKNYHQDLVTNFSETTNFKPTTLGTLIIYTYPTVEQTLKNFLYFLRDLNSIILLTAKSSKQSQFILLRKPLNTK